MALNFITGELKKQFKSYKYFTRDELQNFFKHYEPDLSASTLGWRIYYLKKNNIIKPIKKGIYTISHKPDYSPNVDQKLYRLGRYLKKEYTLVNYCVWMTNWLSEFTIHQPAHNFSIVEVEKDMLESIFYFLKDRGLKNIFLQPDKDLMEKYISEESEVIIIKLLISRSPINYINRIAVPNLEKILVDLFCDKIIFFAYQGEELINIFNLTFKHYSINFSKLLNYAKRRGQAKKLGNFILNHTNIMKDLLE